jgi:hypothetical protein
MPVYGLTYGDYKGKMKFMAAKTRLAFQGLKSCCVNKLKGSGRCRSWFNPLISITQHQRDSCHSLANYRHSFNLNIAYQATNTLSPVLVPVARSRVANPNPGRLSQRHVCLLLISLSG